MCACVLLTPDEAEPLVGFDWGVSPFSGWIQTTFGGNTPLIVGRVY